MLTEGGSYFNRGKEIAPFSFLRQDTSMDSSKFNWKISDYRHRLGIDLRTNQFLGLIRALILRTRKSRRGKMVPYITAAYLDEGEEFECDFEANEVGLLDIHPDFCISSQDLLDHLNGSLKELELYEELFGAESNRANRRRLRYESLVSDVKAIMCANHLLSISFQEYDSIMTQHALMRIA